MNKKPISNSRKAKSKLWILIAVIVVFIGLIVLANLLVIERPCRLKDFPDFEEIVSGEEEIKHIEEIKSIYLVNYYFNARDNSRFSSTCEQLFSKEICKETASHILVYQAKNEMDIDRTLLRQFFDYAIELEGVSSAEVDRLQTTLTGKEILAIHDVNCEEKTSEADKEACEATKRYIKISNRIECFPERPNYIPYMLCLQEQSGIEMGCVLNEEFQKVK